VLKYLFNAEHVQAGSDCFNDMLRWWNCAIVCLQGIYESEQSCTSGSGSGAPLLAQRTVASNIHLHEIIGN